MRSVIGQVALGLALALVIALLGYLHDFSVLQPIPRFSMAVAAFLVAAWVAMTWRLTRRKPAVALHDAGGILVVHASQTGFAAEIAQRTEAALRSGGRAVDARSIDQLTPTLLKKAELALFVVSTTGEGDAPDMAMGFQRSIMTAPVALGSLSFGILALGDRDYDDFCAFGRELDRWLRANGATPAFDRVDVDNGDEGALRHWQHHVEQLAGSSEAPDWTRPAYQSWHLTERSLLNAGSVGGACFHLAFTPADPSNLAWEAGDIAEVGPRRFGDGDGDGDGDGAGALPHREYSIASLPADGALHLVVRQHRHDDGTLGLGSGWLTAHASIGQAIDLRVRRNTAFHMPEDGRPMLLVGNGTGIAGLRALLKARIARGHHRNWLLFGERHAQVDRLHVDELERWRDEGSLERLDLVWSREARGARYVQDRLRASSEAVRAFVDEGASIYVCGSLAGMAPGVDAALRGALGDPQVDDLLAAGRYRRDVY